MYIIYDIADSDDRREETGQAIEYFESLFDIRHIICFNHFWIQAPKHMRRTYLASEVKRHLHRLRL